MNLFQRLLRTDQPESAESFVLIGATAFLGLGFLLLCVADMHQIWAKGDLGGVAMTTTGGVGTALTLLVAYVKGRRADGGQQ
jgi:hypothetical protein